jgi:hypothetical protein
MHGTGLAHALVHGNTSPALRALGGVVTSERRGRGGVHGRARGLLLWGIDSLGRGKPGGEVIGQEMDGGMPTLLGCPRWPWRRPGRCGVACAWSLQGGARLGRQQGGDQLLGVDGGGLVEDQRERVLAGRVCLELPFSLDSKLKMTRRRDFSQILWL